MNIVVLAGGLSPERDVSLSSGSMIANSLMASGHRVLLLDVYEGIELEETEYSDLFLGKDDRKEYNYTVPDIEPDLEEIKQKNNNQDAFIGNGVLELCKYADVVFLSLHGSMGENGQLQATFDNFGIKYTGSGYIGSLLAMDKDLTKKLLVQSGIVTADWLLYSANEDSGVVEERIGYPCVVKPVSCGSSIGVSIVKDKEELSAAVQMANRYETEILIEKMIAGREFSIGILDGKALPVIEIIPITGFYDYKNKYQGGLTKEVCPALISEDITKKLQDTAMNVHKILRLGGYSRIDFILDKKEEIYCLEANTLPGMTPTSLLPQEAECAGISYAALCERIAMLALAN
ncbi:D-alanine--D-alanine ligase A [Anaerocolumna cellulosilytica]|uniref:D-alanine--D-alanine ligase n=1 Tax=Anaerocolumna cellulosilytica TaxID=433286 RepID=A0A6S6QUS3_9FIRM|nr:D-alanine--D-alanine ligase [Anaerocolumna cellulosilytica]MBB5194664.1 D-alanine-D-alanine ligase [Anaerocolumna cellulosilytica]BCJ94374.1 D-alanine--D-alanine ligase A [Anaerocolumna cellulosilytica]